MTAKPPNRRTSVVDVFFLLPPLVAALTFSAPAIGQHVEGINTDQIRGANEAAGEREDHPTTASDQDPRLKQAVRLIVQQTNRLRQANGLKNVEPNEALTDAAVNFARFMARTGKYGHTADGKRPAQRAAHHGYEICLVSENIAYVYRSAALEPAALADHFVRGWKESKEHRENMLGEHVVETGVAVARDNKTGYHFAVQMFGRPKSAAIKFSVTNRSPSEAQYQVVTDGKSASFTLPPRVMVTHTRCRPPQVQLSDSGAALLDIHPHDALIIREHESGLLSLEKQ